MKTPAPPPGSMVVSATQNGSYASQYGLQGSLGAPYGTMQYGQQTQQPMYSVGVQQQPMYGMATTQQPQLVIQSQQQPTFGQNPNVPYSSQPQPPTSFGQPQQAYDFQQYGQAQPYRFP
jgi:cell division septation protein DedD